MTAALLVGLGGCSSPTAPPAPPDAKPILFVHGHGAGPEVFDAVVDHLRERGYPAHRLLAVDLEPDTGANVAAAVEVIAPAVEELVARGGGPGTKVDIVAHSMGALSSRWYATRLRPDRVATLVTVAGANHGTDRLCGLADPGARELCPAFSVDGPVQVGLNGTPSAPADETPYGRAPDPGSVRPVPADADRSIRYVTVVVAGDEIIEPAASAQLAGADPLGALPASVRVDQPVPGVLVLRDPTDHDAVLADDRFLVLLDAILDG